MQFNFDLVVNSFPLLLVGAGVTIKITALSVALGVVIGLFVGIARISRIKILRVLAAIYVDFFRGTPLLVQIFLVYFALPVITGQRVDPFVAAIGSCGINSGAYVAEIFRAGILAVDKGQMEAARSLGLSNWQSMRVVVMPHAIKNELPALAYELVNKVMESSSCSVLGMAEMMFAAKTIAGSTGISLAPYTLAALVYFCINYPASKGIEAIERRMRRGDKQ